MAALEFNFMHEVANTSRGQGILDCIQCGKCSSCCPIAQSSTLNHEYNPTRLMEMITLGSRSDVLLDKSLWSCLSCFTCLDECPHGGDVGKVMFAVRNLAIKEGNFPSEIMDQARLLFKTGLSYVPTISMVDQRWKLGLPMVPTTNEEVQKIAEKIGFDKLIGWPLSVLGW